MQCTQYGAAIGFEPAAFKLVDPVRRCAVAALAIAAGTGRHLVLEPRRPALDAGHEVFGGGEHFVGVDLSLAPHTTSSITLEDESHSGAARQIAIIRGLGVTIGHRFSRHGELLRLGHRPSPGESISRRDAGLGREVAGERCSETFGCMRGHTGEVEQGLDVGFRKWLKSEFGGEGGNPFLTSHGCSVEGHHS